MQQPSSIYPQLATPLATPLASIIPSPGRNSGANSNNDQRDSITIALTAAMTPTDQLSPSKANGKASTRDNFTEATKNEIYFWCKGFCANPNCYRSTDRRVGEFAHIEAASEGGPRYNAESTIEQRRSATNGLFLCPTCHTIIDKWPEIYPTGLLKKWQADVHEISISVAGVKDVVNPALSSVATDVIISELTAIANAHNVRISSGAGLKNISFYKSLMQIYSRLHKIEGVLYVLNHQAITDISIDLVLVVLKKVKDTLEKCDLWMEYRRVAWCARRMVNYNSHVYMIKFVIDTHITSHGRDEGKNKEAQALVDEIHSRWGK
jgi:hypothetical protein